jgi:hypothetical protein
MPWARSHRNDRASPRLRSLAKRPKLCRTRSGLAWSRRLAIMANVDNPASVLEMGEAQATARTLGLEVTTSEIRRAEDIAPAFEALKDRVDALYLCPDPLMNTNRTRINILAVGARLPTIHVVREYVEAGGLMSYGPNLPDQFRRVAMSTRFCAGRNRPTSRSSSRPSSIWSSILRPPRRSGSTCRPRCSPAPTR